MFNMLNDNRHLNQNSIENAKILNSNVLQINGANIDAEALAKVLKTPQEFPEKLLNDLMKSKLLYCRDLLLRGRFEPLKIELDSGR